MVVMCCPLEFPLFREIVGKPSKRVALCACFHAPKDVSWLYAE